MDRDQWSRAVLGAATLGVLALGALVVSCAGDFRTGDSRPERTQTTSLALNATPTLPNFVVYAERSVTLGTGDTVNEGDVGVRLVAPSSFGTQLVIGNQVGVDAQNNLLAPSVSLGKLSIVGDVQTSSLVNNGALHVGHQAAFPSSMPPLPLAFAPATGGTDVKVSLGQLKNLAPGSYGALNVSGIVYLTTGTYSFASVTLGNLAQMVALQPGVVVNVAGTFNAGQATQVIAFGRPANQLAINVAGVDPASGTPVASLGANSLVVALIAAPHGTLSFGAFAHATGAFAAYDVTAANNVDFDFQSGLPSSSSQQGSQQLTGHFVPPASTAPVTGPLPPSTLVGLSIVLPSPNAADIDATATQIASPTSSQFRQYLSLDDITTRYAPTTTDYQALIDWAGAHGLTVGATYSHRFTLHVGGTAAAVEQALHVDLNQALRPDRSTFYALDREPSIDVTATVSHILGLDNYLIQKPLGGSGFDNSFTSSDLRNAYLSCTGLDGKGQSVGIAIFGGYKHDDVTMYEAAGHQVTLTDLVLDSASGNWSASSLPIDPGWQSEATQDVEAAIAMAPGLDSVVTFGAPASNAGCAQSQDMASKMLATPTVKQFANSGSFYFCTGGSDAVIKSMAMTGQSFFEASGDGGGNTTGRATFTTYGDAWVTDVGGTILTMSGPGLSWANETAWEDSGGGVEMFGTCPASAGTSNPFCSPFWQTKLPTANQVSNLYRNDPDVAMPASGVLIILNGAPMFAGGTSESAQLMGGFMAIVNEQLCMNDPTACAKGTYGIGFANPPLYAIGATYDPSSSKTPYAKSFHDIVALNASGPAVPPGPGYDLSTGWGSPSCGLVDQLCVRDLFRHDAHRRRAGLDQLRLVPIGPEQLRQLR